MSDIHPFPTSEQRRAMEKRCRWLQKSRKILERRLAFYVRTYNQVEFDDPLGRREAMGELLNDDPSLRIPALSGLLFMERPPCGTSSTSPSSWTATSRTSRGP